MQAEQQEGPPMLAQNRDSPKGPPCTPPRKEERCVAGSGTVAGEGRDGFDLQMNLHSHPAKLVEQCGLSPKPIGRC